MNQKADNKQLHLVSKIITRSKRTFESLLRESGIEKSIEHYTDLYDYEATVFIKTHSGFLIKR